MCVCVLSRNMVILVNGSQTKEIRIQRVLKQGDPFVPFFSCLLEDTSLEFFYELFDEALPKSLEVSPLDFSYVFLTSSYNSKKP